MKVISTQEFKELLITENAFLSKNMDFMKLKCNFMGFEPWCKKLRVGFLPVEFCGGRALLHL